MTSLTNAEARKLAVSAATRLLQWLDQAATPSVADVELVARYVTRLGQEDVMDLGEVFDAALMKSVRIVDPEVVEIEKRHAINADYTPPDHETAVYAYKECRRDRIALLKKLRAVTPGAKS